MNTKKIIPFINALEFHLKSTQWIMDTLIKLTCNIYLLLKSAYRMYTLIHGIHMNGKVFPK